MPGTAGLDTPPAPPTPFDRSIKTANTSLGTAVAEYRALEAQIDAIPATEREQGGTQAAQFVALTKKLDAAKKAWQSAQDAVQSAYEKADDANNKAKTYDAAGTKRSRLDTSAGNVLVSIPEVADGRGGWSLDPQGQVAKVDVAGSAGGTDTITAAPTTKMILRNGVLEDNPAYVAPAGPAGPTGAVPTSEYIYEDGKPVKNKAYVPPKAPDDTLTTGQKATDAAVAGTATDTAAASLRTLQANADLAETNLATARAAAAQRPTNEQAQRAIQQALDTAQTTRDTALQALEQAKALGPGAVAQQGATLAGTQASTDASRAAAEASRAATQKGLQGDLYGLQDKVKQIRDLIASGEIKPDQGDQMIAAAQRGTDIYSVMKQQASDAKDARTQDVSNKNQLASSFGSTFNSSLNTYQEMNKTGAIGSDATGKAFLATLGLAQDYLKSYEMPAATPTDYLGTGPATSPVGAMAGLAQQQLGAAPPGAPGALPFAAPPPAAPPLTMPAPAPLLPPGVAGTNGDPLTAGSPAHVQPITINIGGQPAGGAAPPPASAIPPPIVPWQNPRPPETADQSVARGNQLAGAASRGTPATANDLAAAFPGAAQRHGLQTG